MIMRLTQWLQNKWKGDDPSLLQSYVACFNTPHGARVLQHLVDNIYATICENTDPIALAYHNGRRSTIHEILLNIDAGENPAKYAVNIERQDFTIAGGTDGLAR